MPDETPDLKAEIARLVKAVELSNQLTEQQIDASRLSSGVKGAAKNDNLSQLVNTLNNNAVTSRDYKKFFTSFDKMTKDVQKEFQRAFADVPRTASGKFVKQNVSGVKELTDSIMAEIYATKSPGAAAGAIFGTAKAVTGSVFGNEKFNTVGAAGRFIGQHAAKSMLGEELFAAGAAGIAGGPQGVAIAVGMLALIKTISAVTSHLKELGTTFISVKDRAEYAKQVIASGQGSEFGGKFGIAEAIQGRHGQYNAAITMMAKYGLSKEENLQVLSNRMSGGLPSTALGTLYSSEAQRLDATGALKTAYRRFGAVSGSDFDKVAASLLNATKELHIPFNELADTFNEVSNSSLGVKQTSDYFLNASANIAKLRATGMIQDTSGLFERQGGANQAMVSVALAMAQGRFKGSNIWEAYNQYTSMNSQQQAGLNYGIYGTLMGRMTGGMSAVGAGGLNKYVMSQAFGIGSGTELLDPFAKYNAIVRAGGYGATPEDIERYKMDAQKESITSRIDKAFTIALGATIDKLTGLSDSSAIASSRIKKFADDVSRIKLPTFGN